MAGKVDCEHGTVGSERLRRLTSVGIKLHTSGYTKRGHCRVSADRGRPPPRLTRLSCDCGSVRTTKGQKLMPGPVTAKYSLGRLVGMRANVRSNGAGQRVPAACRIRCRSLQHFVGRADVDWLARWSLVRAQVNRGTLRAAIAGVVP